MSKNGSYIHKKIAACHVVNLNNCGTFCAVKVTHCVAVRKKTSPRVMLIAFQQNNSGNGAVPDPSSSCEGAAPRDYGCRGPISYLHRYFHQNKINMEMALPCNFWWRKYL